MNNYYKDERLQHPLIALAYELFNDDVDACWDEMAAQYPTLTEDQLGDAGDNIEGQFFKGMSGRDAVGACLEGTYEDHKYGDR